MTKAEFGSDTEHQTNILYPTILHGGNVGRQLCVFEKWLAVLYSLHVFVVILQLSTSTNRTTTTIPTLNSRTCRNKRIFGNICQKLTVEHMFTLYLLQKNKRTPDIFSPRINSQMCLTVRDTWVWQIQQEPYRRGKLYLKIWKGRLNKTKASYLSFRIQVMSSGPGLIATPSLPVV